MGGIAQAQAPTPTPAASAYFQDNPFGTGVSTVNAGLSLNGGATGASTITAPITKSWWQAVWFRAEDNNATPYQPGTTQIYVVAGACASNTCSGGNDRAIYITNGANTIYANGAASPRNNEVRIALALGGQHGFVAPPGLTGAETGLNVIPGHSYGLLYNQFGQNDAGANAGGWVTVSLWDTTTNTLVGTVRSASVTQNCSVIPPISGGGSSTSGFYFSNTTCTQNGAVDLERFIGTADATATSPQAGTSGPVGPYAFGFGVIPSDGNNPPTPSAAVIQNLLSGKQSVAQWAVANGLTVRSNYAWNGATMVDLAGNYANAVAIGIGATSGSPLNAQPCLQLTEQGPGDVFRVTPGLVGASATGTVYVQGTVNQAACGVNARGVEVDVVGSSSGWANYTSVTNGSFRVAVSGVTAGGPYTISARLRGARAFVVAGQYPVGVGYVLGWIGQSQMDLMFSPAAVGVSLSPSSHEAVQNLVLADTGNAPSNWGLGHGALTILDGVNQPGPTALNSNQVGDGIVSLLNTLAASTQMSGWWFKAVNLAKSGQAVDNFAYDYLPATQALTGSGAGPYTATLALAQPIANAGFSGIKQEVKPGTLSIQVNGVTLATDTQGGAMFTSAGTTGTVTGVGVSGGTINYLTGALAGLTFTVTPAAQPQAVWTTIEDTQAGASLQHTSGSGYVTGYGVYGDGVNTFSGHDTQLFSRISGPFSAMAFEQCTSNETELGSTTGSGNPTGVLSWTSKWNYTLFTKPTGYWWYDPLIPTVAFGYPRDTSATVSSTAGCRYAFQSLTNGAVNPMASHYVNGGDYYDDTLLFSTPGALGPHEGPGPHGAIMMGQRMAKNLIGIQAGNNAPQAGPVMGTPTRSGNTITIPFTLPNGTSLATCGPALAGSNPTITANTTASNAVINVTALGGSVTRLYIGEGVSGPGIPTANDILNQISGTTGQIGNYTLGINASVTATGATLTVYAAGACVPTTTIGTPVGGFRISLSNTTAQNTTMVNSDGWDAQTNIPYDYATFSCTLASATSVQCVNNNPAGTGQQQAWTWGSGMYVSYAADNPYGQAGGAQRPVLAAGGAGYTNGTTTTADTGTCTGSGFVFPQTTITVTAGIITAANRASTTNGAGLCTGYSALAVTLPAGGTGGSITQNIQQVTDDINSVGTLLYDNSGGYTDAPGNLAAAVVVPVGPIT